MRECALIFKEKLFRKSKQLAGYYAAATEGSYQIMKKLAVLFLFALTLGIFAQDANLLKNASWRLYAKNDKTSVIDKENGTFSFVGTAEFKKAGVIQIVVLNQTEPKAITFTAESKCEDVKGNTANNYVIYLDILHTDNTYTFGVQASFKNGTHDWEKVQYTYTPKKPIKTVNYYVLFRNVEGKAQFRNITLTQAK